MDVMYEVNNSQDSYIFCPFCCIFVFEYCAIHGSPLVIPDTEVSKSRLPRTLPRAALTIPDVFLHYSLSSIPGAGLGVFSSKAIPLNVRFGPYCGRYVYDVTSTYCWQVFLDKKPAYVIDASDENNSNWMRYINCSRNFQEQNLVAYQHKGQIYYRTIKEIEPFTELLVFYGCEFAQLLGIDLRKYNKEYLSTVNNEDIQTNLNENVYDAIVKEVSTEGQANITDLNVETENIKNISAEETKKQTHNIEHSNENATARTNNSDIHDKLRESLKKYLICDTCGISFEHVTDLTRHILNHPEDIFICDYCDFKTINKYNLQTHIKIKHTKQTIYNCSYCDYKTGWKGDLNRHINSIHTKQTIYNCSYCKYKTCNKGHLKSHINSIHTKQTIYNCSYCDYKTGRKGDLNTHINSIHTKHFFYNCSYCDYKTGLKGNLNKHINSVHTKQFFYNCSYCDYKTGWKAYLNTHINRKHSQNKKKI